MSERKSGESLTWVCKKERNGYQRRERGGGLLVERQRGRPSDRRCGRGKRGSVCDKDDRWALRRGSTSRMGLERVTRVRGRWNERGNEQDGRNRSPVFRHGPDNVRYGRPLSRLVNRSIYVCICVFSSLRQPSPRDTLRGDASTPRRSNGARVS